MIDIKEGTMNLKVYDEELKVDVRNEKMMREQVGQLR